MLLFVACTSCFAAKIGGIDIEVSEETATKLAGEAKQFLETHRTPSIQWPYRSGDLAIFFDRHRAHLEWAKISAAMKSIPTQAHENDTTLQIQFLINLSAYGEDVKDALPAASGAGVPAASSCASALRWVEPISPKFSSSDSDDDLPSPLVSSEGPDQFVFSFLASAVAAPDVMPAEAGIQGNCLSKK
jgi:hypothetical protein